MKSSLSFAELRPPPVCVFMTHGSSTTKTNGRDAGVGATEQRGKLENDDLSDTSPPALAYLYQRTGTGQFTARH